MNWAALISVLVVGGALFYGFFGVYNKNQLRFYRNRKQSDLDALIDKMVVTSSDIEYFTDGHPYYWVN